MRKGGSFQPRSVLPDGERRRVLGRMISGDNEEWWVIMMKSVRAPILFYNYGLS